MFPIIVTSLDLTDNKHGVSSDRFVAVGEEEILYIISNIFAKPQVFYYLVSDASPRVTLLFSGRQTVGSHSIKGDNCIMV